MKISIIAIFCLIIIANSASCQVGEYKQQDGTCNQCDSSCSTCYSSNACATCHEQMFLQYTNNKVICNVCYLVNVGCQVCITAGKCLNCSSGYYLEADATCTKCNKITDNCMLCRQKNQTTYCVSCRHPYKLSNGICVSNVTESNNQQNQSLAQNQSTQISTTPLIKCSSSEITINDKCFLSIAFCQQYSLNGECQKCYFNFPIDNGKCLPAILAMSQNRNKDQQPEDNSNYQPEKILPNLPQCTPRQYFKISEQKCIDVPEQCKSFKKQNGECLECIEDFYIFNGLCAQKIVQITPQKAPNIPSCTARQYFKVSEQKCIDVPEQCKSFKKQSGECLQCTEGFYVFNGLCAQKIIKITPQQKCNSPCLTCRPDNKNFCLSCETGFTTVDEIQGQCFQT